MTHPYSSFWHQTASFKNNSCELTGNEYDILIVGAGLAGINTAYMLMNKGFKIAVIDASDIGYGASGYTTAKITVQHNLIYDYLIRSYGLDVAKQYYKAHNEGINLYKQIIADNKIQCDLEVDDAILYTADKNKIYDLKNELDAYNKLNIESSLDESFDLPFPAKAGLTVHNQYKFNPLKYLYSLAGILINNNIQIYENIRAIDIINDKKPYEIVTDKGSLYADKLIIASHYPFDRTLGALFLKQGVQKSYVIACKTDVRTFKGMYLSIDKTVRSVRFQKFNKKDILILGGCNHAVGAVDDEKLYYEELEKFLLRYFSKYEILSKWSTHDCISYDNIPYIGNANRKNGDIYVATGFNKWGMTSSAVSANIISSRILNDEILYDDIFSPNRHISLNSATIKEISAAGSNTLIGLAKRFLIYSKEDLAKLSPNSGMIVSNSLTKFGVYLDENGVYHCIKPICTHLGCEVKFNTAEKTWDCRCHGSRFDIYGKIIVGPAAIPLSYCAIKREELI